MRPVAVVATSLPDADAGAASPAVPTPTLKYVGDDSYFDLGFSSLPRTGRDANVSEIAASVPAAVSKQPAAGAVASGVAAATVSAAPAAAPPSDVDALLAWDLDAEMAKILG
jgi:hypothetical protein